MDKFFLDYCHSGYLSADIDIIDVRLRVDMQSADIYIYIDIIGEGEKIHYSSFACMETTR